MKASLLNPHEGETDIQKRIINALNRLPNTRVFRNNTGARGKTRYGLCVGSSDVIGWVKGRFFAVEVKKPGKAPTVEQKDFINSVNASNGYACFVVSLSEALQHWRFAFDGIKASRLP